MRRELADENSFHYALIDRASGEIAAFMKLNCAGAFSETDPLIPADSVEVQRLYVMPRFKRRGLGSYLMSKAIDFARDRAAQWVWLGVWQYNYAAQEFYAHWGYERFSEHTFMVGDDAQVDFLLKKKLDYK
ncbi:GNAT family N-acetyltransferase [Alloscardovia omnicolens]|uniref:GNAT family N-acetyltransferase n=1 Tax=Alloscardovia omnicolens TaxID=419015 RepID=UPI003A7421F2